MCIKDRDNFKEIIPSLRVFLTVSLLFVSSHHLFSFTQPKVKSINIYQTVTVFSNNFLTDNIVLKVNDIFMEEKLQSDFDRIRNLYFRDCYYLAYVDVDSVIFSDDSSWVDLYFLINPGPQITLGKIEISGNTLFTTDYINSKFYAAANSCLDQNLLESDIDNLIKEYENNGYPFASASINSIMINNETNSPTLSVVIEIDEGEKIKIESIRVEGNNETKTEVIARETRVQYGEIYDAEKVKKIPQRLNRLKLFTSVEEPQIFLLPDTLLNHKQRVRAAGLVIKVVEGNANTFDGVIGYLPGSASEKGYFTGLVDVGMRNLFGTGRKLSVRWAREERNSQEIGIRYLEPWLFNYPVNLGGSFFQRQQDTTYVRRVSELKPEFMFTENLTISGLFNQENIISSSVVAATNVNSSGTISAGIEIAYDTRDDPYNPTTGIFYKTDYRVGRKKIYSLQKSLSVQKVGIDIELFFETFRKEVFAIGLHGRDLRKKEIELSHMFRFGGSSTLRGYRENQFLGTRIFWSNLEYRFLMARRSYFFGFFDTGYYFRSNDESTNQATLSNFKYGYGVGIRMETGLGIISVSFAFGKDDSFSQAKFHFGLINDF